VQDASLEPNLFFLERGEGEKRAPYVAGEEEKGIAGEKGKGTAACGRWGGEKKGKKVWQKTSRLKTPYTRSLEEGEGAISLKKGRAVFGVGKRVGLTADERLKPEKFRENLKSTGAATGEKKELAICLVCRGRKKMLEGERKRHRV